MEIRKLGAIDIGSNAIRLLINYVYKENGKLPIFNKTSIVRMPIRLGHDVFTDGKISDKNIDRICDAMYSYALMMKVYDVESYLAYATSAMREAKNGEYVARKILEKSKLKIEIIDGKKEAELLFDSELSNFVKDDQTYLYIDVGGGSTELTLLKDNKISISKSFEIGTVRLLEEKVNPDIFKLMRKWIQDNIKGLDLELIGSGGNINHIYKYSGTKLGKPMKRLYVKRHYQILKEMSIEDRMQQYNMKPDRADVVVYALEIYDNIFKWTGAKIIHVPKIGLTDGIIRKVYENIAKKK